VPAKEASRDRVRTYVLVVLAIIAALVWYLTRAP
jgi:cytochrome c1